MSSIMRKRNGARLDGKRSVDLSAVYFSRLSYTVLIVLGLNLRPYLLRNGSFHTRPMTATAALYIITMFDIL